MSSSHSSTVNSTGRRSRCAKSGCQSGNWSAANIAAMVLGFVFFWPLGLVLLYWNITGRSVHELPAAARDLWQRLRGMRGGQLHSSDNVVFDDYQQTQYDRINEIKEEIRQRANRFKDFREAARRRADEEEFNRLMADSPVQPATE